MQSWQVLYTKPHAEWRVLQALEARGFKAYLPALPHPHPRKGRPAQVPYLPCYLFAQLDLEKQGLSSILYLPGLRRVVAFGDRIAQVEDAEIERIRAYLAQPHVLDPKGEILKAGDPVEILAEPFREIDAVFDRRLTPAGRVRVFLRYLEQRTLGGNAAPTRHDLVERLVPLELDAALIRKRKSSR